MKLTRRQLLKHGLWLGGSMPLTVGTALAGTAGSGGAPNAGEVLLYGAQHSASELGLGFRERGWAPRYQGRLDPLSLAALPRHRLIAGFTDEAGLVLLTSLLAGRGSFLAVGRHRPGYHDLRSHRGPLAASLEGEAWQAALGREYARLALTRRRERAVHRLHSASGALARPGEVSFLVRV
ncbi:hypothetical protein [Halomonas sp. H5]|uniref:hypothetical protein n=1 Tax=Halomonas sp. H5 TaxID=3423910 RepID=UPI003D36685D